MLDYRLLDWKLIGAALLLSLIGVLLIFSAEFHSPNAYEREFYIRQLVWLCIALGVFAAIIHLPPRLFEFGSYFFYAIALFLLVLVLFAGVERLGARRWFDFGPISITPSDIAKVAVLLALARFFAFSKLGVTSKRRLAMSALLAGLPAALIMKQPDLGTALVLVVMLFALWFWSGISLWYLFLVVSPIISLITASHWVSWVIYLAILLVLLALSRPGFVFGLAVIVFNLGFGIVTPVAWNHLEDYQKLRIITFLDPGRDPRGAGYQIIQSKIAIGSGGLTGKGLLEGSQSRLDYLPERHTDFIFSIAGEEFGLLGGIVILLLFGIVFYRAIRTAVRCRSAFLSFLAFGAMSVILFQTLVNAGMTLGMMPVTGLPMPFVSYGGTSLVLMWSLVGMIVLADYNWQEY